MTQYLTDDPVIDPDAEAGAVISDDGAYRYRLWRAWDATLPSCTFIMLNPSTADGTVDDATIRKCVKFATAWGFGRIDVLNLYGLRARDPKEVAAHPEPVGPDNDSHIIEHVVRSRFEFGEYAEPPTRSIVVCAWGAHGSQHGRDTAVLDSLAAAGVCTYRLGTLTAAGNPRHPLFLPDVTVPESFTTISADTAGECQTGTIGSERTATPTPTEPRPARTEGSNIMADVVWEDAPPAARRPMRRAGGKYRAIADVCRENQGKTALLDVFPSPEAARSIASNIERGRRKGFDPAGAFTAAADTETNKVYVTYVGMPEGSERDADADVDDETDADED